MKKELKDYLHLYLGANYIIKYKYKTHYTRKALPRLTNGSYYNVVSLLRFPQYYDVKLVLRPLGDMTQEYANELWEHLELNGDFMKGNGYRRKGYILKAFLDNYFEDIDDVWDFDLFNRASMKLRKDGFDCDGLIEAGLAIDKTTISNEN